MKRIARLLQLPVLCAALAGSADAGSRTVTRVLFLSGGEPVRGRVSFEIACTGWNCAADDESCAHRGTGADTPPVAEVFRLSSTCDTVPCDITEPFHLEGKQIDHCDMDGSVDGRPFSVKRYAKTPVDFSKCTNDADGVRRCELKVAIPDAVPERR